MSFTRLHTPRTTGRAALALSAALATLITAAPTSAQTGAGVPPNYSWNFATITHPGNRLPTLAEYGTLIPPPPSEQFGRVDYVYRIATTEVTNRQWFEFVQAYAPYVPPEDVEFRGFNGSSGGFAGFNGNVPSYRFNVNEPDHAVNSITWRYAARFVNWLHNGKPTGPNVTRDAFERGAYDTSTFGYDPKIEQFTDQRSRSAGARFWIPSADEWTKAVYFDPNRYGPGQAGYWRYPMAQNTQPIYGPPGQPGAQSSVGQFNEFPVGLYPDARSPWGLLDASGGVAEFTETATPRVQYRVLLGSSSRISSIGGLTDSLGWETSFIHPSGWDFYSGFRIASAVPAPGSATVVVALGLALTHTRRRPR